MSMCAGQLVYYVWFETYNAEETNVMMVWLTFWMNTVRLYRQLQDIPWYCVCGLHVVIASVYFLIFLVGAIPVMLLLSTLLTRNDVRLCKTSKNFAGIVTLRELPFLYVRHCICVLSYYLKPLKSKIMTLFDAMMKYWLPVCKGP
jgi:hypothetical protein